MKHTITTQPEYNFTPDHPIRIWIEQEEGRSISDLAGIHIHQDLERDYEKEAATDSQWKLWIPCDVHYEATFKDGSVVHKTIKKTDHAH